MTSWQKDKGWNTAVSHLRVYCVKRYLPVSSHGSGLDQQFITHLALVSVGGAAGGLRQTVLLWPELYWHYYCSTLSWVLVLVVDGGLRQTGLLWTTSSTGTSITVH
jgi:hypothetical protein